MRRYLWSITVLAAAACGSRPEPVRPTPAPAPTPALDPSPPAPAAVASRYPRSGAGILHYAFSRLDSVVATMPSGEEQVQLVGRTAYLTLTWIAADTGTRLTATVDSLVPDIALGTPEAAFDSVRGARWSGLRRPDGGLAGLTGGPASLLADQVRDQLSLLFPRLPEGGARASEQWTDSTVVAPVRVSAFEASETALSESSSGAPDRSGALPIQVVRNRSATGEGTQFGQPITVSATGSDTLAYSITPDGVVVDVSGHRVTDIKVDLPAVGQSVLAREVSLLRMTLLR